MLEKRKVAPSSTEGHEDDEIQSGLRQFKKSRIENRPPNRVEQEAEEYDEAGINQLRSEDSQEDESEDEVEDEDSQVDGQSSTDGPIDSALRGAETTYSQKPLWHESYNRRSSYERPRQDPVYGQRSAFPGLGDESGAETLLYGDPEDGLEYLRMVRSVHLPFELTVIIYLFF
jgi:hypothetical protein